MMASYDHIPIVSHSTPKISYPISLQGGAKKGDGGILNMPNNSVGYAVFDSGP